MELVTKEKKGFKRTEVGLIPEDWKLISLDELTQKGDLIRGPFGGALKKEFFVDRGFKVYEQKNAIYSDYSLGNYFVDEDKFWELRRFEVQPDDFIVSCSGTIGRVYQIPEDAPKGIINQALLIIRLDPEKIVLPYFLNYFSWENFQDRIIDSTQGGAMKNLVGMDKFRATQIPIPPTLTEQQAIASALSDVDELIRSLDGMIQKKRAIKKGTMQQLLTGKIRLPGFDGKWPEVIMGKDASLKARIGWQGLRTDEYLENGEYYLVTGTDFKNGRVDWKGCHYVEYDRYKQDTNIQLKEGDVLVTKDGTIGKVAIVEELNKPATLNSGVFVIRPTSNKFVNEFLFYTLSSIHFTKFLDSLTAGSTINHLYQKDFVTYTFNVPPTIEEQKAIAYILSDMDRELQTLRQKREKYVQIKQGMMQELLTGKTRLI